MIHNFERGDFLIFQIESGFALLRVLGIEENDSEPIWHIAAYKDLFLDSEMADAAIENSSGLSVELPHIALTNRAFQSTQVAKMRNLSLTDEEERRAEEEVEISDRSVRLLLGLR
jgi:hypothetical protein